jgi:NitT/TauT family transport system permease protein
MSQMAVPARSASTEDARIERALHDRVLRETRRQGLIQHAAIAVGRALLIGSILGVWAYAAGRWIDDQSVSNPVAVFGALYDLIATGRLWPDLWQTVFEVVSGYVLGAVAAVMVASLFAIFPAMEQAMRPLLIAIYSIPKVALAPLIVMWFGLATAPKIILAGGFVFFIVFMNVIAGIESVNRNHVNIVRVMGAGRVTILRKIVLPTAIPFLFLGLRLAIPEAMIGAVIGEFISGSQGLGFLVYSASNALNTAVSMAALVVLVIVVAVGDILLGLCERFLLPRQLQQADPRGAR